MDSGDKLEKFIAMNSQHIRTIAKDVKEIKNELIKAKAILDRMKRKKTATEGDYAELTSD